MDAVEHAVTVKVECANVMDEVWKRERVVVWNAQGGEVKNCFPSSPRSHAPRERRRGPP